jgi:hypothetical protein
MKFIFLFIVILVIKNVLTQLLVQPGKSRLSCSSFPAPNLVITLYREKLGTIPGNYLVYRFDIPENHCVYAGKSL